MLSAFAVAITLAADEDVQCKTFASIYGGGKNLCEKMWGDAFVYSTDEEHAYTMFFYDAKNPNDVISERLAQNQTLYGYLRKGESEKCLSYLHKGEPSPEPEDETNVCYPWRERSCCHSKNVRNGTQLKEAYGAEFHWDRCGKLSTQCEQFFINEACMYECEPATYHFMKYPDHPDAVGQHPNAHNASNPNHNQWELFKMPIKSSYCDAWYHACRNDLFCSADDGNYFTCALEYKKESEPAIIIRESDDSLSTGWIIGITAIAVFALVATASLGYLVKRERQGKPVYKAVNNMNGVVVPVTNTELQVTAEDDQRS